MTMKCSIDKYIIVVMVEASSLNKVKKVSYMLLKQDSSSNLDIQEILYNKGHLATLKGDFK